MRKLSSVTSGCFSWSVVLLFLLLPSFGSFAQLSTTELIELSDETYESDPPESYELAIKAEVMARKENDSASISTSLAYQARYILLKGDVEQANELLSEALKYSTSDEGSTFIYKLKAIILGRLGQIDEAIRYNEKAVESELRTGDTSRVTLSMINLSSEYLDAGYPDKSIDMLERIRDQWDYLDEAGKFYYYQNRGDYYRYTGEYDLALKELKKARDIAFDLDMQDSQCTILLILGETQMASGNYDDAIRLLKWSRELSVKYNLIYEELEAIAALSDVYEKTGQYGRALELYKREVRINDSLYGVERVNRINRMERQLERAEQEKQLAQKDAALRAEKLEREAIETRNQFLLYVAIILVVLIGFILYTWYKTRSLNKIIIEQKGELLNKNVHLQDALKDIHDSFNYGRRLQQAFLPSEDRLKSIFDDAFVLYKPKEIVSGDFYWLAEKGNNIFFAVGDCTGHGVPGAMLSVVGANGLNQCIEQEGIMDVNDILDRLRIIVKDAFSSDENGVADGMDISLCCFNALQGTLEFAGANNPLWLIRGADNSFVDIRGDRQPVGSFRKEQPFTKHTVEVAKGDKIYLFSDGYQDQFGGEFGKKLKTGNFKKLILSTHEKPFRSQQEELTGFFNKWKRDIEQIDDVCLVGLRL